MQFDLWITRVDVHLSLLDGSVNGNDCFFVGVYGSRTSELGKVVSSFVWVIVFITANILTILLNKTKIEEGIDGRNQVHWASNRKCKQKRN